MQESEATSPNSPSNVIFGSEETSLHYPFNKNKNVVVGNLDNVFARIKQSRSGKPHVLGTLPKLDVSPDPGYEIVPPQPAVSVPQPRAVAEKSELSDEEREAYRKQRKKERRLARKEKKKAAEAAASVVTTLGTPQVAQVESDSDEEA